MPIMSAISALWGIKSMSDNLQRPNPTEAGSSGMLGAQGARLAMDMAWNMLVGVRQLGRNDLFCKMQYQQDIATVTAIGMLFIFE